MLEEAEVLMEAYASAEAGAYLISKAWKGQAGKNSMGWADPNYQQGDEGRGKPTRER